MELKTKLRVKIAENAGFCFGVRRAIDLTEKTAGKERKVYTLGPVIHNPQEVKRLEKKGIKTLKDPKKLKSGSIILRTHGIPCNLHKKLEENKNINVIDAACPFVKRAQNTIKRLSTDIKSKDKTIIVVGEKIHPEVIALVSYGSGKCIIVENIKEAQKFRGRGDLNIVSQTTQTPENFNSIIKVLKKRYKTKVYNTICKATLDRQKAAEKLAKNVDLMIVIGGKNSGNTTRLAQICSEKTKTYHIETACSIKEKWFKNINSVGLTAGASTPDWIIKEIEMRIKEVGAKHYLEFISAADIK
ncbi:MAG: 4-hydroxy-3-methylbut-2-enyl diphosphate reductase [Candidatus Endomicrobiellum trichonymphae]|uniref:4-hydroxy-3-methylbut-2-enyl diphosphate reductase n=1 Tax=Endomicrobium trichonymphae TaxID=1408204 RepID=UPI0027D3DA15|nr:MAG: 4-hydroxy-3-methylbut-2-enyl diphosphate reductase [Candidatus Endomicrobium trichonymphae]